MSIRLEQEDDGKVLAIRVSGKLTRADYELLTPEFERLIRQHGKIRMLFVSDPATSVFQVARSAIKLF